MKKPVTPITREPFGNLADGTAVELYTLTNAQRRRRPRVMTYGAHHRRSLECRTTAGTVGDVVLGYDDLDGYSRSNPVLRRDRRPLRQPHRQGRVHPRRAGLHARRPTTARTTCTAGSRASTRSVWTSASRRAARTAGARARATLSPDGEEGYPRHAARSR